MARVHQTAARQFARDLVNKREGIDEEGVENVGKRTPSHPMETGCHGKSPSDRCMSVRKRLSKYTARIHRTVASQLALETGRRDKS